MNKHIKLVKRYLFEGEDVTTEELRANYDSAALAAYAADATADAKAAAEAAYWVDAHAAAAAAKAAAEAAEIAAAHAVTTAADNAYYWVERYEELS